MGDIDEDDDSGFMIDDIVEKFLRTGTCSSSGCILYFGFPGT